MFKKRGNISLLRYLIIEWKEFQFTYVIRNNFIFACAGNKNSRRYDWKFNSALLFTLNLAKITVHSCNFVTCWKERPSVPVYAEPRSFKFTRNLIFEQKGLLKRGGRGEREEKRAHADKAISDFRSIQFDRANCRHARRSVFVAINRWEEILRTEIFRLAPSGSEWAGDIRQLSAN